MRTRFSGMNRNTVDAYLQPAVATGGTRLAISGKFGLGHRDLEHCCIGVHSDSAIDHNRSGSEGAIRRDKGSFQIALKRCQRHAPISLQ